MGSIIWNEDYSVGVDKLDTDHIIIISLINHLQDARMEKQEDDAIERLLEALIYYVELHFAREEAMMVHADFDGFEAHVEEHRQFTRHLEELRDRLERKGPEGLSADLGELLSMWLVDHILETDKAYRAALTAGSD